MRIAILTLPLHTNYGGILQAYALQTVLERMGHEVLVLDKRRKPKVHIPFSVSMKRFVMKHILRMNIPPIGQMEDYKRRKKRNKNTWNFADQYIHRYEIDTFESIKKDEFDVFVVGSDQIWRKEYILNNFKHVEDAFLGFAKKWNVKRIAYAPSFGHDVWDYSIEETVNIQALLKQYDSLSVREYSGVELCIRQLGMKVQHVVDPTMLLTAKDYIALTKNTSKSNGNLLCYVLDMTEKKQQEINDIAKKYNLKPFSVNANVEAEWETDKVSEQPPVEQWLRGFMDAHLVITDSFHACVFSIIFNKQFIVMDNSLRGSARIDSLLCDFSSKCSLYRMKKLNILRKDGLNYLMNAICLK